MPMAKLLAALLSVLIRGECGDGNNNISIRLPVSKLLALLSILVHILPADCQWQSCWRRCCLFWFIFCPQTANSEPVGGAVVYFISYFVRRLAVAKLVAALLSTQLPGVNPALAATDTLNLLLDLFFKYSLNNFLHAQVPPLFFFNTVWMHICLRKEDTGKQCFRIRIQFYQ
jgi:hypothetical protein